MNNVEINTNQEVEPVFNNYPNAIRKKIENLRTLIIETANEIKEISEIEETLKWGEPSYLNKKGSTIRIDWKKSKPKQYAMYFSCSTKLVTTFRTVYKDSFSFEGNRAIVFRINDNVPEAKLKKCITAALLYKKVKHLPTLGI
ncbi:DUF1801 domain-containing protein [Aquimarina sp. MMG016]|uniref:DUF1801 domain-containing protein n=1 Tax=Aquimarina sp. MMG016 TaxID=2822690 RepID=UPI001B39D3F4|nr:DUF1801 domain-containing protein [Aquimarina sp. MMG016]MBQ4821935.1 DUF1801 domain-containing protein [Aquimarina sp. MMG016]